VNTTAISDAIEHLVRVNVSDRDALVTALRELAELVDHDLTPKALPSLSIGDRVRLLRDLPGLKASTEGEVIDVLSDITVDVLFDGEPYPMLTRREDVKPVVKQDDAAGYETDAEPQPQHGEKGTCATCGGRIQYSELEDDGVITRARWGHLERPPFEHDAVLGGAA